MLRGPVIVGVDATSKEFRNYKGGVFSDSTNQSVCGNTITHALLAVGYGHDDVNGLDYAIVKNSWGETWGEEGFMKISLSE